MAKGDYLGDTKDGVPMFDDGTGKAVPASGFQGVSSKTKSIANNVSNAASLAKLVSSGAGSTEAAATAAGVTDPGMAAALGNAQMGSLGWGPLAAVGGATYLGGKAALDMLKGKKADMPGRVILGMATGGLSELGGLLGHKTTAERTKGNYGSLAQIDPSNKAYQDLVAKGQQESLSGADTWDLGQDKTKAPIDLMTRSYGVLNTFGPDWSKLSADQQKGITQKLVDNDLLNSKQGDYQMVDTAKAMALKDEFLKNYKVPTTGTSSGAINPAAQRRARASAVLNSFAPTTQAPRYDLNQYQMNIKNPYA